MKFPEAEKLSGDNLRDLILTFGFFGLLIALGLAFACYSAITTITNSWSASSKAKIKNVQPAKPLKASEHVRDGKYHLLLAATGSVATIKIPNILEHLSRYDNLSVRVVLSESAAEFLQAQSNEQPALGQIAKLKNVDGVYRDSDEWAKPWVRGDSILHIELRRWADLMVIAPLSANSLAKIAMGLSDNLVTSVVRAWDTKGTIDISRPGISLPYENKKGIIVAPAMNTAMWDHPITGKHMEVLSSGWSVEHGGWIEILRPIEKSLACGDTGSGAMCDWREIVATVEMRLRLTKPSGGDHGTNGWQDVGKLI